MKSLTFSKRTPRGTSFANITDIMPPLAVGNLHLKHVLVMLDVIRKCSTPLQIARKHGRKWSFVIYSTRGGIASWMRDTHVIPPLISC